MNEPDRVAELERRLSEHEEHHASLNEQVSSLEAQLAALEDPLQRFAARISALEKRPIGGDAIALPAAAGSGNQD